MPRAAMTTGTDWQAANEDFTASFHAGQAFTNRMRMIQARNAKRVTVTTECSTYSGRYASTTRCRSTAD